MIKKKRFANTSDENDENDLLALQKFALKSSDDYEDLGSPDSAEPVVELKPLRDREEQAPAPAVVGKASYLDRDMVITGSISSVTNITIEGQVNGNVSCESDAVISGSVDGNISACNVTLTTGKVNGNIVCKNKIRIDKESFVKGDVTGESLECGGGVEGNISMKVKAAFAASAVILGDITSKKVSIEEGAMVKGKLQTIDDFAEEETKSGKIEAMKVPFVDGKKYI